MNTKYTNEYFIKLAEQNKGKYSGYVYIGVGDSTNPLSEFWEQDYIQTDEGDCLVEGIVDGLVDTWDYYVPENIWNEKIKPQIKKDFPVWKIREEYDRAVQYIGKTINYNSKHLEIGDVELFFDYDDLRKARKDSMLTTTFFDLNDWVIVMSAKGRHYPYDEKIKIAEDVIEVQTITGEKYKGTLKNNIWTFGCATISQEMIRNLLNLNVNCLPYCKHIESVQIGECIFPIETLIKMSKM